MLALLVSVGLLLQVGAGVCGSLMCGDPGSAQCCPGQPAEHEAMDRAPCGCCDLQTTCSSPAFPDPMVETAQARVPASPALPVLTRPEPLRPRPGQRLATAPGQARPPPALPLPTATIVLLI